MKAVVTQPNGSRSELDPETIEESGLSSGDPLLYEDRRAIRAPLPNVQVGAEIAFEITTVDREPFFAGGALASYDWGDYLRVEESELEITHPVELALHLETRGLTPEVTEVVEGGRRRLRLKVGALDPLESSEPDLPPELLPVRQTLVSVAPSWSSVASAYAQLVDRQLLSAPLEPVLASVPTRGEPQILAAAALSAIQAKIRYTGLEFGAQAIVPARPQDVLKRGFGDCKDRALMLVAALRARGVGASVALVQSGGGVGPSEQVPGLNAFDHAIAYVEGNPPLWIDATVDGLVVGQVPPYLQGAQALIARANTRGLTTIPTASSEASTQRWVKDVYLPSFGNGRLHQEVSATGWRAYSLWSAYRELNKDERNQRLTAGLESAYGGGKISSSEFKPGKDDQTPKLHFQAEDLPQAATLDSEGSVPLSSPELFHGLPYAVRHRREKGKERQQDLLLYEAYRSEMVIRVHLPPGFVPRALPAEINARLGPAFYTRQTVPKGEVVEVNMTFDSGPRRWSAADFEAFFTALEALGDWPTLLIDHSAMKAAAAGRPAEALRLGRAVVQQQPKDAVELARLSWIHGQVGFGKEARELAKRATALDPGSFFAHFYLGLALSADLFGRSLQPGTDRSGAIAAFKEAKRLGPKYTSPLQSLAQLYERNQEMEHHGPGSEMDLAIEEYRALQKLSASKAYDLNLTWALLHAGRAEEAIAAAKGAPAGHGRNVALAIAVAKSKGLPRALETLRQEGVDPAEQQKSLLEAIRGLSLIRSYETVRDAQGLLATSVGLGDQNSVAILTRMQRIEDWARSAPPEQVAAVEFYRIGAERPRDPAAVRAALAKSSLAELDRSVRHGRGRRTGLGELEASYLEMRSSHAMMDAVNVPRRFSVDGMVSTSRFETEGDAATGYRVKIHAIGVAAQETFFLVQEEGKLKIRGWGDLAQLGAEALARVRRQDLAGARRWLAWARPLVKLESGAVADNEPFVSLEGMEGEPDAAQAEVQAAALMIHSPGTVEAAIPILERAAKGDSAWAMGAQSALAIAYVTARDFPKAERLARAQLALEPEAKRPLFRLIRALIEQARGAEAKSLLATRVEKDSANRALQSELDELLADGLGDFEAAYQRMQGRRAQSSPDPHELNAQAWLALFLPNLPGEASADAIQAATMTQFSSPAILHTLGCIYAVTEQPAEAMKVLKEILRRRDHELVPADWLIFGRIAESYGLKQTARAAYDLVEADSDQGHTSSRALAGRWRRRL